MNWITRLIGWLGFSRAPIDDPLTLIPLVIAPDGSFPIKPFDEQRSIIWWRAFGYSTLIATLMALAGSAFGLSAAWSFGFLGSAVILTGSLLIVSLRRNWWVTTRQLGQGEPQVGYRGYTPSQATWGGALIATIGFIGVILIFFMLAIEAAKRIWEPPDNSVMLSLAYLLGTIVLALFLIWPMLRAVRDQFWRWSAPWLLLGFGTGVVGIVSAWLACSWLWAYQAPSDILTSIPNLAASRDCEIRRNQSPLKVSEPRIAISLSGGGYRAALIHAGLLASLDEFLEKQKINIDILTTVSGGSIVGAAYAQGISPSCFAAALWKTKPGLANDLLHLHTVVSEVFGEVIKLPLMSKSFIETYSDHLDRVFYKSKDSKQEVTLGSLHEKPLLLVNVTDVEANRTGAREILYREHNPKSDPGPRLADVVAASAAFPGPFQPKHLAWRQQPFSIEQTKDITPRKFVDGGVVENLGIEGLRLYMSQTQKERSATWPHVLIISDASGHGNAKMYRRKADLVSLLQGAMDISFELLHKQLYAAFTSKSEFFDFLMDDCCSQSVSETGMTSTFSIPYEGIIDREVNGVSRNNELITIPIPSTSKAMAHVLDFFDSCTFSVEKTAKAIQEEVREYNTLLELKPDQVRKAYWLGRVLGNVYRAAVWHAIQQSRESKLEKSSNDAPRFECPSSALSELFKFPEFEQPLT